MNSCTDYLASDKTVYRLLSTEGHDTGLTHDASDLVHGLQTYLSFSDEQREEALTALAHGFDVQFQDGKDTYTIVCGEQV